MRPARGSRETATIDDTVMPEFGEEQGQPSYFVLVLLSLAHGFAREAGDRYSTTVTGGGVLNPVLSSRAPSPHRRRSSRLGLSAPRLNWERSSIPSIGWRDQFVIPGRKSVRHPGRAWS
jgi:hypothetical protein